MSDKYVILLSGILAVTFIDTAGAIASRKFNFRYSLLIFFSLLVYILIGFFGSRLIDVNTSIVLAIIVALYDATAGLWFSIKLKANFKMRGDEMSIGSIIQFMVIMIFVALIFSVIGYALSQIH